MGWLKGSSLTATFFLSRQQPSGSSQAFPSLSCLPGIAGVWPPTLQCCLPAPPRESCPHPQGQAFVYRWGRKLQYNPRTNPAPPTLSNRAPQAPT